MPFPPNIIDIPPYDSRSDLYDWMQIVFVELDVRGILHHIKGTPRETKRPARPSWDAPHSIIERYLRWQTSNSEARMVITQSLYPWIACEIGIRVRDTALDVVRKLVWRFPPSICIFDSRPSSIGDPFGLSARLPPASSPHQPWPEVAKSGVPFEPLSSDPPSRHEIVQQIQQLVSLFPPTSTQVLRLSYWSYLLDLYDKIGLEDGEETYMLHRNSHLAGLPNEYSVLQDNLAMVMLDCSSSDEECSVLSADESSSDDEVEAYHLP